MLDDFQYHSFMEINSMIVFTVVHIYIILSQSILIINCMKHKSKKITSNDQLTYYLDSYQPLMNSVGVMDDI